MRQSEFLKHIMCAYNSAIFLIFSMKSVFIVLLLFSMLHTHAGTCNVSPKVGLTWGGMGESGWVWGWGEGGQTSSSGKPIFTWCGGYSFMRGQGESLRGGLGAG